MTKEVALLTNHEPDTHPVTVRGGVVRQARGFVVPDAANPGPTTRCYANLPAPELEAERSDSTPR